MHVTRIIAVGILAIAAIAAVRSVAEQGGTSGGQQATSDPLAAELDRCRQLGEKAEGDRRCQAAYAENNKRFFAPPAPYVPSKVDLFPNNQPWTTDKKPAPAAAEK